MGSDDLAAIFDEYYPAIYRYLYYRVRHVATAEDLAAQVFRQWLVHVRAERTPIVTIRAWLFRVVYNLVVDDARQNHIEEPLYEDSATVTDAPLDRLALEAIYAALDTLTEHQRQVITLRFLSELEFEEIATIMNTTIGAIKALQHRAIAQLRHQLNPEVKDETT